jgi:hypothetical protein
MPRASHPFETSLARDRRTADDDARDRTRGGRGTTSSTRLAAASVAEPRGSVRSGVGLTFRGIGAPC